jgi:hypothetical protein
MSFSPTPLFQFDGLSVRPITEQDRPFLWLQIQADEDHRDWMDPDFFLKPLPGESSWALEDEDGCVIFYFKNSPAVRMSIQFIAEADHRAKRRNMTGLMRGLAWIEAIFSASRFREIVFDTKRPELRSFAKRRLGFVDAPELLSRVIPCYESNGSQPCAVGTVPTDGLERAGQGNVRT